MIMTPKNCSLLRTALMAVILITTVLCSSCKGKEESTKTESIVSESAAVSNSGFEKDFDNASVETTTADYVNITQAESIGTVRKSSAPGTLNDFKWYFENDFPIDGNVLTELQDLGGNWKVLINVVTPVDGEDQCRLMVGDIEVQYMGYKVTLLMTPKERYQFMISDPNDITTLQTSPDGNPLVLNGDWNDEIGEIDAETEGGLRVVIIDFVEAGGVSYALGTVLNRDKPIGEIAMFR